MHKINKKGNFKMPGFIKGIDVSQWQGSIDFNAVRSDGIAIVYIKSSEGFNETDPFFERNYDSARAAGLSIGVYHYVTARTAAQAITQAHFFASRLHRKSIDCRLAMDFEDLNGLGNPQIRTVALAFLQETEKITGKKCIIYSDYTNALRLSPIFARYPLWQAQYGVRFPSPLALWPEWTGWQYSDSGHIRGISGATDLDYFKSGIYLTDKSPVNYTAAPPPETTGEIHYRVRPGDTLSQIARLYHTSVATIAAYNKIKNPNLIYAGQLIRIPVKSSAHETVF